MKKYKKNLNHYSPTEAQMKSACKLFLYLFFFFRIDLKSLGKINACSCKDKDWKGIWKKF